MIDESDYDRHWEAMAKAEEEDNFSKAFKDVKGTVEHTVNLDEIHNIEPETNNIEFYKALAEALHEHSTKFRWTQDETFDLDVNGKTYKVGPFVSVDMKDYYCQNVGFSFPNDSFAVYAGDSFDSWGYEENNEAGVDWYVAKIVRYVPVYESIY